MTATVAEILESVAADVSTPADERAIVAFLREFSARLLCNCGDAAFIESEARGLGLNADAIARKILGRV